MVREVTNLVRELKQWSEGDQEAPTTALGPASGEAGTGGRCTPPSLSSAECPGAAA